MPKIEDMELISSYLPTLKPSKIDSVCCSTYYRSSNLKPPYPSGTRVQKCQEEIQAQQIPAYTCKRSTRHAVSESSCIASVTDEPATKPDQTSTSFLRHNQTMGNHFVLFTWLISHNWKYCWLIYCKKKILFVDWKIRFISGTNVALISVSD